MRRLHARTATPDGALLDPQGKPYSHGTTPCMVFDVPT
jgi:hypothetical protein